VSAWTEEREAELRAGGWSDDAIRDYKRGWESAAAMELRSMPVTSWVPDGPEVSPVWGVLPAGQPANQKEKDQAWLAEHTTAGTLRAFAQPAIPSPEARMAHGAETDRMTERRRQSYREACREVEAVREAGARAGDEQPPPSFDEAHPYAADAARLAVQLGEAPGVSVREVTFARTADGTTAREQVSVTAPPQGGVWFSGSTHALQALLRQVNPFADLQIGAERSDRAPVEPVVTQAPR
jgi:hypothetical protein